MAGTEKCSFCGEPQGLDLPMIAGLDGHICPACVKLANQVVSSWGKGKHKKRGPKKLLKPEEIRSYLDDYVIGQGPAKETLSVAVYNHFKRLFIHSKYHNGPAAFRKEQCDVELEKSNVLLAGPTGSGKTLLIRTLAKLLDVPCVIADATTLTQAGYVGDDVENVIARLVEAADGNVGLAEWGIVYLDEIDKLSCKGEGGTGMRDISGEGVQQALLKMIEGTNVRLPSRNGRREENSGEMVNTSNILFIGGGAFAGVESLISRRLGEGGSRIGFHADLGEETTRGKTGNRIDALCPDDLKKFGLIPEFIGRFHVMATLQQPEIKDLVSILTQPKNALVKQYQSLFSFDGAELEFTGKALQEIARQAMARGAGARGLRSVMEGALKPTMYMLPSRPEIIKCIVNDSYIRGEADITYVVKPGSREPIPHGNIYVAQADKRRKESPRPLRVGKVKREINI